MKLYAQHGSGDGGKTLSGLSQRLIQGVVFSPKDLKPDSTADRMDNIRRTYEDVDVLLDPQFYVNLHATNPKVKLGKLPEWNFFRGYVRAQLENPNVVDDVLKAYLEAQAGLPITGIIAPNIYISRSFDSLEAAIAKNFLRRAAIVYESGRDERPLYVTVAVSREALLQQREFDFFLNDITALEPRPHGFYLLVGARSSEVRTDVFHADVVAAWMMLNHALTLNGFRVINGYSDILTPLLGVCGGVAGATGWWSNLRMFSMERFLPGREGGRLPIVRYLSIILLNRITFTEKEAFAEFVPEVINGLPHDDDYAPEPQRADEVLQSWEAIGSLIVEQVQSDITESIKVVRNALDRAENAYRILKAELDIDPKSNDEHIQAIREGIDLFVRRAEL